MTYYYKLIDGQIVPAVDAMDWGLWLEGAGESRRIGHTDISPYHMVSTVFVGIDMSLGLDRALKKPPMLFETGVFFDGAMVWDTRWSTLEEAIEGHEETVRRERGY